MGTKSFVTSALMGTGKLRERAWPGWPRRAWAAAAPIVRATDATAKYWAMTGG